jgi:hypothetical protein
MNKGCSRCYIPSLRPVSATLQTHIKNQRRRGSGARNSSSRTLGKNLLHITCVLCHPQNAMNIWKRPHCHSYTLCGWIHKGRHSRLGKWSKTFSAGCNSCCSVTYTPLPLLHASLLQQVAPTNSLIQLFKRLLESANASALCSLVKWHASGSQVACSSHCQ